MEGLGTSQFHDSAPSCTMTSQGKGMMKPYAMASTKGGHCLTVRTSWPWVGEKAPLGMARSQSGKAARAGSGGGKCACNAGSHRKTIFISRGGGTGTGRPASRDTLHRGRLLAWPG